MPDELWQHIEPILERRYPRASTGRPRADFRPIFNGLIYRLRTGTQWNHLPEKYGDDSTIHR